MTLRILWGSPLPPIRSGVSDYSVELLPSLAKVAEVRVLRPPGFSAADDLRIEGLEYAETDAVPRKGEVSVIHLGNNPYHRWLVPRLASPRCVAVLHDLVLHHLLVESTLAEGEVREFERLIVQAHGSAGRSLAEARRFGVTSRRDPFLFPARGPFLDNVEAVVVHSNWGVDQVKRDRSDVPVLRLAMPAKDPGPVDDVREALRGRLGAREGELLVMHIGFLTPAKGLQAVLEGLAILAELGRAVRLVLVGEGKIGDVLDLARALGVSDRIQATGWLPADDFLRIPAAADLGVVLRSPSAGETSAAALRFLACGTPVAVTALHQFLEWPSSAAYRVTPGPSSVAELVRIMLAVSDTLQNGSRRRVRGVARRAYIDGHHRPEEAAAGLAAFLAGVFE